MSSTTQTWDFEGYWNTVIGAYRSPAEVLREFNLASHVEIEQWLVGAEKSAIDACGEDFADGRPEEWDAHHARALAKLRGAAAE